MAGETFLRHDGAGGAQEREAVQTGGSGSENRIPALDSGGRLDTTMMPTGIGADTQTIEAGEALAANDVVNIYDDAGTPKVRKADATVAGKEAMGFVLASVAPAASATVYFEGQNEGLTGLTAGPLYLSTTAGQVTSAAPSASGNIVQRVGFATSATSFNFDARSPVALA